MSANMQIRPARAGGQMRRAAKSIMALAIFLCLAGAPAVAHEFWLEPSNYRPQLGEKISITLRNGQFFKGSSLPYIKSWFERFIVATAGKAVPVEAVEGDDPAATIAFSSQGLSVSAYLSTPDKLNFKTRDKFESYLKKEGLDQSLSQFAAWRPEQTSIRESYIRCAKTLIGVAGAAGNDRALGLPLEIVAQRNPFELPAPAKLPVRIFYQGRPMPGLMIKVFSQKDPATPQILRTDKDGRAIVALPASGAYLLNAVHMLDPPVPPETEWKSYWASMTFYRP